MEWAAILLILLLAVVALGEVAARALRISDYPLYRPSAAYGYGFAPGAEGLMRRRYRWNINRTGLRLDHDEPPGPDDVLLIGDSTVESGAHCDQDETIAARLARETGRRVFPVACPAWSLENELAFLSANPELLGAGTAVFVTNSDDLIAMNPWETETTHPTHPPLSHLWYKLMRGSYPIRRKLFPALFPRWPDPADRAWTRSLGEFLAAYRGRIVWLFYPLKAELAAGDQPCSALRPLIADRAETSDIAALPGWSESAYSDHIHPSARGKDLMLEALVAAISRQDRR